MTDAKLNVRKDKAAWGLSIPRGTARGLLALEFETRRAILAEVIRVDPHAALAWLRTQPNVAAA